MTEQTTQVQRSNGSRWLIALLVAACLVQSFLIFRLSAQVKDLQMHLTQSETMLKAKVKNPLVVGEVVPTLAALGRDGVPLSPNVLDFSADRVATVIIALGTACPTCEEMLPELSAWAKQVSGDGVVVVGVQIDAMKPEELKQGMFNMPLVYVQDGHKTWLRRVSLVPSICVFDRAGTLRAEHQGVPDAQMYKQVEALLIEARRTWN